MFNPHVSDQALQSLKDADLEARLIELTKKYNIAAGLRNVELCHQIAVLVQQYNDEKQRRYLQTNKTIKINDKEQNLSDFVKGD